MARYVLPVRELDLRLQTSTVTDRMNAVPGFKTSAAFFLFLRANLVLPPSTLNSTTSTPLLDPSSSQTLPPLGPSSLATMTSIDDTDADLSLPPPSLPTPSSATNPLEDIPDLTTKILTTEEEKIAALKLVADSIAQQTQIASRALIFHPLSLAGYGVLIAVISQLVYQTREDLSVLGTTLAGVTMACLVAVRSLTGGYLTLAEGINWNFIRNGDESEDFVLGSKFGDEIIGAAVLRLERSGNGNGTRKKAKNGRTGGKGLVRAWTVRLKYRGRGVGTELLEEAVRITRDKLGRDAEIGFAVEHANSKMILWDLFNGRFRKGEVRAARKLEAVINEVDGPRGKKR